MSASSRAMIDEIARGLEGHVMTALLVSGALALMIVAGVGVIWTGGRRWVRARGGMPTLGNRQMVHHSGDSGSSRPPDSGSSRPPDGEPGHRDESRGQGAEPTGARIVREAATRAAKLRDSWDRSYREARGTPEPPERGGTPPDLEALIHELLGEQRETNALLRQLLDRPEVTPR